MLRWLVTLAVIGIAGPSFAATFVTDPASTCINSDEPSVGWATVTVATGNNRKFVVMHVEERNTDPAATFTVGGQAPTETARFATTTPTSTDHYHYLYIWNEAAIVLMTGSGTPTLSYSDANTAVSKAFCYGTIQNTAQANVGTAFTDSDVALNAGSLTLTTTSGADDLVVVMSVAENTGATHTWSAGITEIHDADGGDAWRGGVASGNSDSVTVTYAVSTEDVSAVAMVFPDEPVASPVFTVGPTEAPAANGHTISGTVTGTGTLTVYAVSTNPGAAVPTCNQIESGTDGSDVAARVAANEVWVTGVSNNFPLTEAGNAPESDVYVCAENASGDSAVTSLLNQLRSADASQAITEFTGGLDATSPFAAQTVTGCDVTSGSLLLTGCGAMNWLQEGALLDLSSGFADITNRIADCVNGSSAGCAANEILLDAPGGVATSSPANITTDQDPFFVPAVASDDTTEGNTANSLGGLMSVTATGIVSCAEVVPGDLKCTGYNTWAYNAQDVSHASTGNFTSGPPPWGTDDLMHVDSSRPVITIPDVFLFYKDVALSGVVITCVDPNGQAISVVSRTAQPTGVTQNSDGTRTGTPTVEDEVGTQHVYDCLDSGGLYATPQGRPTYVTDDAITNPNGVGDTRDEYNAELAVVRPWILTLLDQTSQTTDCSPTVASGDIISTSPAAAATITAVQQVAVVVSTGSCAIGAGGNGASQFGVSPFL